MFDLGLILKTLREQHGYTQAEVAKKLNIAPGTVSRWETNDNTPSTERLIEIAILYNTPINHLIGRPMEDTLSINKLTPDQQHIIMAIVSDFTQKEINHLSDKFSRRQQSIINALLDEFKD